MERVLTDLKESLALRAMNLLQIEAGIEKDKDRLRAYWRGIVSLLDLRPGPPTLRWGYGFINSFDQSLEQ